MLNGASDLMVRGIRRQGRQCPAPPSASLPFHADARRWRSRGYSRFHSGTLCRARARLADRAADRPSLRPARSRARRRQKAVREAAAPGRGSQANFSIECDIQLTADGEAMVHHDDALGRLHRRLWRLARHDLRPAEGGHEFKDTSGYDDGAGRSLRAGRRASVPLVIEVKSHFDGDRRLSDADVGGARFLFGTVVGMSFDPDQVLALREKMPALPRAGSLPNALMTKRTGRRRRSLSAKASCTSGMRSVPSRISWRIGSTIYRPPAPWIARNIFRLPLLTWTVRTPEQRARRRFAMPIR